MSTVTIHADRLDLVLQTPAEVLAWVETLPEADRKEFSPAWLVRVRETTVGDFWSLSFRIVERASGAVVGGCAFKGPPDADGMVELAYGIDENWRGNGFATEAAAALADFASRDAQVRVVRAHTKSDNPASIRVLEKCGFQSLGEVIDPEDGLVLRWEIAVQRENLAQ